MAKKQNKRRSRNLVLGYVERISSSVFSDFPRELTDLVGATHGVYALYKGDRLYYVGLATNLRNRIKGHLGDRHKGKWDRFSLYLVRKADHVRELESLILRVADPTGNATRGRLPRAEDLLTALDVNIRDVQEKQRRKLLGTKRPSPAMNRKVGRRQPSPTREPALAPYVTKRFKIRMEHEGRRIEARVRSDGTINYHGATYTSPSIAGARARGRKTLNGWKAWKYRNEQGEWVYIDELRRKGRGRSPRAKRHNDFDTIICPAREQGFRETFLGRNCWYAIRLSTKKTPAIKYIAAYQKRPVSAITHYARVRSIKPYRNTGKYIVTFAGKAKKLQKPVGLGSRKVGPQGPFFGTLKRIRAATTFDDL